MRELLTDLLGLLLLVGLAWAMSLLMCLGAVRGDY